MDYQKREDFFDEIREELEDRTQNSGGQRFVTLQDLKSIWTKDRLLRFCAFLKIKWEARELLEKNLLQTLSILVSSCWTDWPRFVEIFIDSRDNEGNRNRFDNAISTYTHEILANSNFLGKKSSAQNFLEKRYNFMPIVIKYGEHLDFPEGYRLPFTKPGKEIGEGSYGKVTEEEIAAYQYVYKDKHPNTGPVSFARKRFEVEGWFLDEVSILRTLQWSLSQHDRIASFLATIRVGNEFHIFSQLAIMNLDRLLYNEVKGFEFTLSNMIVESANLAHALDHLHCQIRVSPGVSQNQGNYSCCHLDLKPENILVYSDSTCPIGMWKITDFGISSVKQAVLQWRYQHSTKDSAHKSSNLQVPSPLADPQGHLTNQNPGVSVRRGVGTWQPPEVQWSTETIDGQKADIWSFGCIFMQLLVRSLAGIRGLKDFDSDRTDAEDGTDDRNDTFYRQYGNEYQLNPAVNHWIKSLGKRLPTQDIPSVFLNNCQELLHRMLHISPKSRPSAKQVIAALDIIFKDPIKQVLGPEIKEDENRPVGGNLKVAVDASQPRPQPTPSRPQMRPSPTHAPTAPVQTPSRTPLQLRPRVSKGKGRADMLPATPMGSEEIISRQQEQSRSSQASMTSQHHSESPDTYDDSSFVESPVEETRTLPPSLASTQEMSISRRQTIQAPPTMLITPPEDSDTGVRSVSSQQNKQIRSRHNRYNTIDFPETSRRTALPQLTPPPGSPIAQQLAADQTASPPPTTPTATPSPNFQSNNPLDGVVSPSRSSISEEGMSTRPMSVYSDAGSEIERNRKVITFPVPKVIAKTVVQTVISTHCNKIAFIAPTEIQIFPITNQLAGSVLKPAEPGRTWLGACLTEDYILTRAKGQLCDIFSIYKISLHTESKDVTVKFMTEFGNETSRLNGVLSEDRFVLFQYPNYVTLKDLKSKSASSVRLDVPGTTKKVWFNASGSLAMVRSAQGQYHYIDAWEVEDTSQHRQYRYRVPDRDNYETPIEDVISFPSKPSCLIWKYGGHIDIRPLLEDDQTSMTQEQATEPHTWSLKPLQAIIVGSTEDTIIYVRRRSKILGSSSRIYKCRIFSKGAEEWLSRKNAPKGIELEVPLQEPSMQEDRTFCIAVKPSKDLVGGFQVFIVHSSAKVEVITL